MIKRLVLVAAMLAAVLALPLQAQASPGLALGLWQDNSLNYHLGGVTPGYAIQYFSWQGLPNLSQLNTAASNGSIPVLEMQSCTTTITNCDTEVPPADINGGAWDSYLTSFANVINSFGHPVLVTFDHEMNGGWYPWGKGGSGGVTVTQWQAMWHHVMGKLQNTSPYISALWAPNIKNGIAGFDQYWPPSVYPASPHVDYVGLDGYYRTSSDTWASVFGPSVTDLNGLTSKPFVVSETAVDNTLGNYTSEIDNLVSNARSSGAIALMWFDKPSSQWTLTSAGQARLCSDMGLPC